MSVQSLTYESVLALIRENSREMLENSRKMREEHQEFRRSLKEQGAEFDRRMEEQRAESAREKKERKERDAEFDRRAEKRDAEYARMRKELNTKIGDLGNSIGRIIEHMVAGNNIIKKFKTLDYEIESHSRNKQFGHTFPKDFQGEIDLFLENGDIAILIEVKATLETKDVRKHMECLEKFRRFADIKKDTRRFIGAVAGAVIEGEAMDFAHENGMYVIVQSGKAMEIVQPPEGFKAKEW